MKELLKTAATTLLDLITPRELTAVPVRVNAKRKTQQRFNNIQPK